MHGDVFLPVLGKLRNVACYRGIQVDLALAVQLHDGLCRGHDLGAGCHVEHGIHLHGAGIVQPHAHVVEHCVAVCLFIHDLAAACHHDRCAGEISLSHVVFHNVVDGRQAVIGPDGHCRPGEAVLRLLRAGTPHKGRGSCQCANGFAGCDQEVAPSDLFHARSPFLSAKNQTSCIGFRKKMFYTIFCIFIPKETSACPPCRCDFCLTAPLLSSAE